MNLDAGARLFLISSSKKDDANTAHIPGHLLLEERYDQHVAKLLNLY